MYKTCVLESSNEKQKVEYKETHKNLLDGKN